MVIYSNNLHQKLQGIAISKEYLKYNTPFCDIVDDPEFELDFDLAIGYTVLLMVTYQQLIALLRI